jgi:four helix bundle protein
MAEHYKKKTEKKIEDFVHAIYDETVRFPREEMYVTTAQLKRAALSILLNYVEGYARFTQGYHLRFIEIAYGSLKEVIILIRFAQKRNFCGEKIAEILLVQGDEIGALLWTERRALLSRMKS